MCSYYNINFQSFSVSQSNGIQPFFGMDFYTHSFNPVHPNDILLLYAVF